MNSQQIHQTSVYLTIMRGLQCYRHFTTQFNANKKPSSL